MLIMSLVVAALVGTSAASSSYFGSCLSAPVISDFNIAKVNSYRAIHISFTCLFVCLLIFSK